MVGASVTLRPLTKAHPHEAEQHDVLEEGVDILSHGGPTQLDDQGVTGEPLDVGKRLHEHLGSADPLFHGLEVGAHVVYSALIRT
jgi:hypothetical protein